jgi:hypothetical protein
MKTVKHILIGLIPLQWFVLNRLKKHPEWVDHFYSSNSYPKIFDAHRFFFNILPFSFGDFLYLIVVLLLIVGMKRAFQKKHTFNLKKWGGDALALLSLLSLLFHMTWGLNYYRSPLNESLNFNSTYTEIELIETLEHLIEKSNELHASLSPSDTVSVQIPYSYKEITEQTEKDFSFDLLEIEIKPFIKNSLWSTLLSYMGYAGYLNPFTLESHVNKHIPKLSYITTSAHEMAHQLGFASESEANFIAFYTSVKNPDPFIQFAGTSFALRYCYGELYKANPEQARKIITQLHLGILKNFQQLSDFWKNYQNPFEPYLKKGYDSYLKANGQKKGIQSYNDMVSLVIAFYKKGKTDE